MTNHRTADIHATYNGHLVDVAAKTVDVMLRGVW
jgi:hypothetical protein